MSIINKMHQDFQQVQEGQPILADMPKKKGIPKVLILSAIIVLIGSSLGLSYLIITQDNDPEETKIAVLKTAKTVVNPITKKAQSKAVELVKENVVQPAAVKPLAVQEPSDKLKKKKTVVAKHATIKKKKPAAIEKKVQVAEKTVVDKKVVSNTSAPVNQKAKESSSLEIKAVTLNKTQLADIYLKEADKAEAKGALDLAAKKRLNALTLLPKLNTVRQSLALYYHGQGNVKKAMSLLKVGAQVSPDYSDFNLMLSRIALKAGDYQKAYLYLEQNPPEVEGHLDYYVSHALLARKFKNYEQSERLYTSLLSQRPNNGRWIMSLAIAQDRQAKVLLAVANYQHALLQTDLSSKAKNYINQRLAYLDKQ